MKCAEIVLPIALDKSFHYLIPEDLRGKVIIGSVVRVPFRNLSLTGYCVGLTDDPGFPLSKMKFIKNINEDIPPIKEDIFKLTKWISEYYLCSHGEAIEATLPSGVRKERKRKSLSKMSEEAYLKPDTEKKEPFPPTEAQVKAINTIKSAVDNNKHEVFLLHGITGSGKTEVYLQVIDDVIKKGKQAIVLVPEISLTPQTVKRFGERFDRIAVLHSYLTEKQRAIEWKKISNGEIDVVIGARSAIFAPTKKLGIVVIDEEHETSFKQESTPRYHAREVSIKRAEIEKAVVVLGSATPSLESYYDTQVKRFSHLDMPERIEKRPLPVVEIVDMTQQKKGRDTTVVISRPLENAIKQALMDKEQVILFLNRRGYLTLVMCPRCKYIIRCDQCRIALTFHKNINKLQCHHCSTETEMPKKCPDCGHNKLVRIGSGTERIEEYAKELFKGTNLDGSYQVNRMDSDVMQNRKSGQEALDELGKGQIDILIGTQLVAKGLDFPNVTLVGIVSADTGLYLNDFRSAERTFQLIAQVAGRTGRGEKGGRVILQTLNASHYSISNASKHDFHSFAKEELEYRKSLFYPPYSRLLRILVEGKKELSVQKYCEDLALVIKEFIDKNKDDMEILGPTPCPWSKIRGNFRWQLVIKSKTAELIQSLYRKYKTHLTGKSQRITLDMDPISLL
jgi:primosomal protein N' (replication factor Y)